MTSPRQQHPSRIPISTRGHSGVWIPGFSLTLFLLQMLTGTDPSFAGCMSIAVFSGLMAVEAAGGCLSALGLLNFILLVKMLLFGLVLKLLALQPTDTPLADPINTGTVFALGFSGVWLGTKLALSLPRPGGTAPLLAAPRTTDEILRFFQVAAGLGFGAWAYHYSTIQMNLDQGDAAVFQESAGGLGQLSIHLGSLKFFAIACAVHYLHARKSARLITHPLLLTVLALSFSIGLYSSSKKLMLEPVMYLTIAITQVRGPRYPPMWVMFFLTGILYVGIIYPYSSYARSHGGRSGTTGERIEILVTVLSQLVSDARFREEVDSQLKARNPYLPVLHEQLNRMCLFVESDRLIAASSRPDGWETILFGFEAMIPRAVYPDKPHLNLGNHLGMAAGDVGPWDRMTSVAYGFMAHLYYALGHEGVFLGSAFLIALFFWVLILLFGQPVGDNLWLPLIVGSYHHVLVESTFAGVIFTLWHPLSMIVFYAVVRAISATNLAPAGRCAAESGTL